jgi:hypothetical protein
VTGWLFIVALIAVPLLIVAVIAGFAASSRRASAIGDPSPVVKTALVLAAVWAGISAIGAVVALLVPLLSPSFTVAVPTEEFWPALPAGVEIEGLQASVESGGFTSATLQLSGVGTLARTLLAVGAALSWLVPGTEAALLAVACFQLLAGRAFAPSVARMTMLTAVVVAAGGMAAQVIGDIGTSIAASEALASVGASWSEIPGIEDPVAAWWPAPALRIEIPFWPIGAGLGLAALAAVFRYGSVLQRDTEGLV